MAAVAGIRSAHATLSADTADTVTLSGGARKRAEVVAHDGICYFRKDGTTAVAAADETEVVLSGERLSINLPDSGAISIIGASGETPTYSVIVTG